MREQKKKKKKKKKKKMRGYLFTLDKWFRSHEHLKTEKNVKN